jgi:hypothetical protein
MAYDKGCVVGEVIDIVPGDRFDIVVVLDRSKPQYPNEVACEFVGKSRELVKTMQVGDWVSVEGSIRSKRSQKTNHWFTNFVCYAVGHLEFRGGQEQPKRPTQHHELKAAPPPTDDELPF